MKAVNVNGEVFDENKIKFKGKMKINKQRKTLRIVGGIIGGIGAVMLIYLLAANPEVENKLAMTIIFIVMLVAGLILLGVSFLPRNEFEVGLKELEKEIGEKESNKEVVKDNPLTLAAIKKQEIIPDKTINVNDKVGSIVELQTDLMIFKLINKNEESSVLGPNDITSYELIVDNEEVYNSKKVHVDQNLEFNGKHIGKGIKDISAVIAKFKPAATAAKIVGGAGTLIQGAGVDRKSQKDEVHEYKKSSHHFTFVIRLNNLKTPAFVAKDIDIEVAETLANTFAIIFSHNTAAPKISETNKLEIIDVEPEVVEVKSIETKSEPKQIGSYDKFEEIRKYKELLDSGIITQEEFDQKKKELL